MSMWQTTKDKQAKAANEWVAPKKSKFGKYTHWPNPLANMVKSIHVLACEDTWQAVVEMWAIGLGNFAWNTFIPSPVELTRKATMGAYKCGFYLPVKVPGPLDIIWSDGAASAALLEIARPLTTGLFAWWATETFFSFMSTYTSLMEEAEFCDADGNETLLKDGVLVVPGGFQDWNSGAALYEVMYDPKHRYAPSGYEIIPLALQSYRATAFGYVDPGPRSITNCSIFFKVDGVTKASRELGSLAGGKIASFNISYEGGDAHPGTCAVWFVGHSNQTAVLPIVFKVTRFTMKGIPPSGPERMNPYAFPYKEPFCGRCYAKLSAPA